MIAYLIGLAVVGIICATGISCLDEHITQHITKRRNRSVSRELVGFDIFISILAIGYTSVFANSLTGWIVCGIILVFGGWITFRNYRSLKKDMHKSMSRSGSTIGSGNMSDP